MEITVDYQMFEAGGLYMPGYELLSLGVKTVGDFLDCNIEETIKSLDTDDKKIIELKDFHRKIVSGEIKVLGRYLHRDFEAGVDLNARYFRHSDGIRYHDVRLAEIISDDYNNMFEEANLTWLSQIIGFKGRKYQEITGLGAKESLKIKRMVEKVKLRPALVADMVDSTMAEKLFYKIWNCLNELVGVDLVDHYYRTINIYGDFVASCGLDYDLDACYNDKTLGNHLSQERCFEEILQRYIVKLLRSECYGKEKRELYAMLPVLFQDSKLLEKLLDTLMERLLITELVPGRFVAGSSNLTDGMTGILTKREKEVFVCRVEDMSVKEIAAKLGVGTSCINSHLRSIFTKIEQYQPLNMIDAYMDIFHTYCCIRDNEWEEILGDKRY